MNDSLILTLCQQEETLLINNAIVEQLGSPSLIQVSISESDRSLLVRPCEYGVRGAIVIPENLTYQLELPADTLIRRIRRVCDWTDSDPRVLCGVYIPQHNAIYFSLDAAQFAILQPVPEMQNRNATGMADSTTENTTDSMTNDTHSSTLPMREGLEASALSREAQDNGITVYDAVDNGGGFSLAGAGDGDLNG